MHRFVTTSAPDNLLHEQVFLLHGYASPRAAMSYLDKRLAVAGYATVNWGYPSLIRPIESHIERLRSDLHSAASNPHVRALHLVTHSMGGILVRQALCLGEIPKLRRIVMLAPPNRGVRLARWIHTCLDWLCRPIEQLSDAPNSYVNCLAHAQAVEVGVLAASTDLLVPRSSTHLAGECDYAVVPSTHLSIVFSRRAADMTLHFLRHGSFCLPVGAIDGSLQGVAS